MEDQKKNVCPMGDKDCNGKLCCGQKACACGCGCGWASGHRVFRVVLGIVIALLIFWLGVKAGELRVVLSEYGGGGYGGYGHHHAYPMMMGGGNRFYGPTTLPSAADGAPSSTTTPAGQ